MKRLIVVTAVLLASVSSAPATPVAEWQSWFGGPAQQWANSVEQLPDGGYLVAGTNLVQPGNPIYGGSQAFMLARTNADGKPVWQRQYRLTLMNWGANAVAAGDGGFVMVGTAHVQPNYLGSRIALMKTDANGNVIWTRFFSANQQSADSTHGVHVQRTADGGYIILGSYHAYAGVNSTILLIRTNASGYELWRTRPGDPLTIGTQVRQTADGGFAVCGSVSADEDDYGTYDLYLLKTGAGGAREWSTSNGTAVYDACNSLRQTSDGGFALFGETLDFGVDNSADYILARYDALGKLQWQTVWGGRGDDWSGGVAEIDGGGFVTTGSARSADFASESEAQIEVSQISAGGRALSSIFLGEPSSSGFPYAEGMCVEKTDDGGFIVGGMMVSNDYDVYLVKLAPVAPGALGVAIDIKPGSTTNPVNLASNGTTPVAIFGSADFDAAQIDPSTVTLAGAPVATNSRGKWKATAADIDEDGTTDLLVHVVTARMAVSVGDTSATLTGQAYDGTPIEGSDRITVLQKRDTRGTLKRQTR